MYKIAELDNKINKLIDIYLEGTITLEEYQRKKESYINEKKELQEALQDFVAGTNNWFEPARDFVTLLNSAHCAVEEKNLESQKEFLEKIGSNFILKERRLVFSSEAPYGGLLQNAQFLNWRGVYAAVRKIFIDTPK